MVKMVLEQACKMRDKSILNYGQFVAKKKEKRAHLGFGGIPNDTKCKVPKENSEISLMFPSFHNIYHI